MQFAFGGTVYQSDGSTPAANVEIGVSTGGQVYTVYSATNGNFWFEAATNSVDWNSAVISIRNENGETTMSTFGSGTCNLCHEDTQGLAGVLIEPQP